MNDRPSTPAWSTDTWRDLGGRSWLDNADRLEAMLAPVLEPLFGHAALRPGERVLDVGCGRGATTFVAAELVGASGAVAAVDVSADLIADARSSAASDRADRAPIDWIVADAQRGDLGDGRFDAVISRFGVMFFDDPVEAFANLRRATRDGGRVAIATWQPRDACDFQALGWQAIVGTLRSHGYAVDDPDPTAGPYAFGVDDVVRSVLDDAGWRNVDIHPVELALHYGGPGASPEDAVGTAMGMPALQSFLASHGDGASELATAALLDVFSAHHDGTGVRLDATIVMTTATT